MIQKIQILLLILISNLAFSQEIKGYKYVSIPIRFYIMQEANQFNLNESAKKYMQNYGYESYFDNDKKAPEDFISFNCQSLFLDIEEEDSTFSTNLKVVLKDCKGRVIYTSKVGISKDKDFKIAYTSALRKAFQSMKTIQKSSQLVTEIEKNELVKEPLYTAKPIENGFELILNNNVDYTIYKTKNPDVYIAKSNYRNRNGVLILKEATLYYFQYIEDGVLKTENVTIVF